MPAHPSSLARPSCASCMARAECVVGRLSVADRVACQALVREQPFSKGSLLEKEGEVATSLRIVKLGMTLQLRTGHDGHVRPVALLGAGQLLGKFGLMGQPNVLTCVATTSGRFCEIDLAALERSGLSTPAFQRQLSLSYVKAYSRLADWAQVMRIEGIQGRLVAALTLLARSQRSLLVRMPSQRVLSQLLGARRETIARALRTLEKSNTLVRRDRWHCELTPAVPPTVSMPTDRQPVQSAP